jgi:hypothetical protein
MKAIAPFLVFLNIFAVGCTGPTELSRVEETRESSPKMIESGDVVTFVRLSGVREDMLDCIHNATRDALPEVHVISPAEFRDSMFPWFEPNNAPGDAEALSKIMLSPIVKQKVDDLRARYIVTISGESVTHTENWGGVIGGPQAAVVIAGGKTEESIALNASILDLRKVQSVADIEATAKGSGQSGFIVVIPYVFIPETATIVCKAITERVVAYFRGEPQAPPEGVLRSD